MPRFQNRRSNHLGDDYTQLSLSMTPHRAVRCLQGRAHELAMPFCMDPPRICQPSRMTRYAGISWSTTGRVVRKSCVLEAREGTLPTATDPGFQEYPCVNRPLIAPSGQPARRRCQEGVIRGPPGRPGAVHSTPGVSQSRSTHPPPPPSASRETKGAGPPPRSGVGTSTTTDLPRQGDRVGGRRHGLAGAHGSRSALARVSACAFLSVGFPPGGSPRP